MNHLETLYHGLNNLVRVSETELAESLANLCHPDARWYLSAPMKECSDHNAIIAEYLLPLRRAFSHLHRRTELFLCGESRVKPGQTWVSTMGHLVGNFSGSLFGLAPNHHLAFVRFGEFYHLEDGKITEARILIDWVDLMRQAGCMPLTVSLGTEMPFPCPASHDGVRLTPASPEESATTVELVESMIFSLTRFDPTTFESAGQTGKGGFWHENMLWYGPAGIGSNLSYEGFQKDHRIPFLNGFPDRIGGDHYSRFGCGPYACSGGWPSVRGTHNGDYLGVAATGKPIGMRVMDFWRAEEGQLIENWVFIDFVDLFAQMGVDLLERARHIQAN